MKIKRRISTRSWTAKSFMAITLLIVGTIVALSSLLYVHFERITLQQNYAVTLNNLKQTSQEARVMAVTASTFAKQIYNDPEIQELLNYSQLDSTTIVKSLNRLDAYRATSPFIASIYIYKANGGMFYTSSDVVADRIQDAASFYDTGIVDIIRQPTQYPNLQPIPRRLEVTNNEGKIAQEELDCYTFLFYDTLTKSRNRDMIVVNVSETQLHKTIDGMLTNADTNTFILDANGTLVSNSWKYPMLSDLRETPFVKDVLSKPNEPGYFVADVDGTSSLVSYSEPDPFGWRYVRTVPYREITRSIERMKLDTARTSIIIILVGALISLLLSKRLFSPADKMLARLRTLESKGRDMRSERRGDFLRNMLFGWEWHDTRQLKELCGEYAVRLEPERKTGCFLIQVEDYEQFVERYSGADRKLLKFGIANIAEELGGSFGLTATADLGEDRIALLYQPAVMDEEDRESERQPHDDVLQIAGRVQQAVQECLKLNVTITGCKPQLPLTAVHQLYDKTLKGSAHRLFAGKGCLLDADRIERMTEQSEYTYPQQKEKQLLEELKLGRTEQAKRLFEEILRETERYPVEAYLMTVARLSIEIGNAIEKILAHHGVGFDAAMDSLMKSANQAQTLDQVFVKYFALFDELSGRLEEKRKTKHEDAVQRIIEVIHDRYMDQKLSLDAIAEELGLSPAYIGRLFKQHTFKTILGYITEVRMSKAQSLLSTTDLAVGEVAEQSGFSNSPYFYKAFKKFHGVSPAEFRRHGQSSASKEHEGDRIELDRA